MLVVDGVFFIMGYNEALTARVNIRQLAEGVDLSVSRYGVVNRNQ